MAKAYSYLRFSTPEQQKGDSKRRQSTAAQEYAARHGLELDTALSFQDLGVSAFRGKNTEEGDLNGIGLGDGGFHLEKRRAVRAGRLRVSEGDEVRNHHRGRRHRRSCLGRAKNHDDSKGLPR